MGFEDNRDTLLCSKSVRYSPPAGPQLNGQALASRLRDISFKKVRSYTVAHLLVPQHHGLYDCSLLHVELRCFDRTFTIPSQRHNSDHEPGDCSRTTCCGIC